MVGLDLPATDREQDIFAGEIQPLQQVQVRVADPPTQVLRGFELYSVKVKMRLGNIMPYPEAFKIHIYKVSIDGIFQVRLTQIILIVRLDFLFCAYEEKPYMFLLLDQGRHGENHRW